MKLFQRIRYRWRSSVTGRFVKRIFALAYPRETQRERAD
jgi:hypothetical protein